MRGKVWSQDKTTIEVNRRDMMGSYRDDIPGLGEVKKPADVSRPIRLYS